MLILERYAGAIEYDLHAHCRLDLLDFFRHRYSWRKLLTLLEHLPTGSAFWAARVDDDELARALWDKAGGKRPTSSGSPLALQDLNPVTQLLMNLEDGQTVMADYLARLIWANPPRPRAVQRPLTAMDRLERRAEAAAVADLVAEAKEAQRRAEEDQQRGASPG